MNVFFKQDRNMLFHFLLLTISLLLSSQSLYAETGESGHDHGHHGESDSTLSLNEGEKWKTDAPLRQGMQKINHAFMSLAPAFHNDTLTKPEAVQLAKSINQQVDYLIANCKLEPKADTSLHVLISELLEGASVVSKQPLSMQGMPRIHKALMQYPDYFDHSGWSEN